MRLRCRRSRPASPRTANGSRSRSSRCVARAGQSRLRRQPSIAGNGKACSFLMRIPIRIGQLPAGSSHRRRGRVQERAWVLLCRFASLERGGCSCATRVGSWVWGLRNAGNRERCNRRALVARDVWNFEELAAAKRALESGDQASALITCAMPMYCCPSASGKSNGPCSRRQRADR